MDKEKRKELRSMVIEMMDRKNLINPVIIEIPKNEFRDLIQAAEHYAGISYHSPVFEYPVLREKLLKHGLVHISEVKKQFISSIIKEIMSVDPTGWVC